MTRHQLEEDDREIEYLEKKLGLSGSNKKGIKDERKRLNKELRDDGFGDDIMSFLDQMDHVMEDPDMDVIAKDLSATEIATLQQQVNNGSTKGKLKSISDRKFDMNALEKEASSIPKDIGEDDGEDDDTSDGLVDVDFLKSFAKKNGMKVVDESGKEEKEMESVSEEEEEIASDMVIDDDEALLNDDVPNDVPSDIPSDIPSDMPSEEEDSNEEEDNENSPNTTEEDNKDKEIRYEDITDIYGRVKEGKEEELKQFTSKYVPPHLRNKSTETDDELEQAALKQIREVVNKVTDDTFITMCQVQFHLSFHIDTGLDFCKVSKEQCSSWTFQYAIGCHQESI